MEFFNGSQDLAAFAAGIIPFGAAMKSYGDAVADIRPEAVESSASAGMALVELAKALPNTAACCPSLPEGPTWPPLAMT